MSVSDDYDIIERHRLRYKIAGNVNTFVKYFDNKEGCNSFINTRKIIVVGIEKGSVRYRLKEKNND